ncbi:MAG: hypothetical protein M3O67_06810 [Bacteroidota bacterium]|nr:hypothetical protein [Bacteroidota bacterium]
MKVIGFLLLLAGLAAIVLNLMKTDVQFLNWIDQWGTTTGWVIRGVAVLLGLILIMSGRRRRVA